MFYFGNWSLLWNIIHIILIKESLSHYFPVISKEEAGQFLQKRSTRNCYINRDVSCCTDITHETWCEQPSSKSYCAEINESGRETQCTPSTCGAGFSCYLDVPCVAHYRTGCYQGQLCPAFPCMNGGTCVTSGSTNYCICQPGYDNSTKCVTEIDECASNPCVNGWCADALNAFSCVCNPGYSGTICEIDIDECASNPCQNGLCIDGINAFNCSCHPGYTGILCETDINECLSNPCDHGECLDQVNGYRCQCHDDYYGLHCQNFDTKVFLSLISLLPILAVVMGILWYLMRRRLRERENTRRGLVPFKDTSLGGAATKFNVWTLGKDHPYGHFPSSGSDASSSSSRSSSRSFLQ